MELVVGRLGIDFAMRAVYCNMMVAVVEEDSTAAVAVEVGSMVVEHLGVGLPGMAIEVVGCNIAGVDAAVDADCSDTLST